MKKILSVLMAAILLCTVLVGCGGGSSETSGETATVKVTVEADGKKIVENVEVTVESIEFTLNNEDYVAPVAIDAVIAALEEKEIEYTIGDFYGSERFEKIDEYELGEDDTWELYLNGDDKPAEGRIGYIAIEDGDELLLVKSTYESTATEATTEEITIPTTADEVDDGYEE